MKQILALVLLALFALAACSYEEGEDTNEIQTSNYKAIEHVDSDGCEYLIIREEVGVDSSVSIDVTPQLKQSKEDCK